MMKKRNILIVDDDENLLRSLEFILETANYKVTIAHNGLEGLEKILESSNTEHPVELLITDFQMPGINGLDLIEELNRRNIAVPKVAITAFNNRVLIGELKRHGCDEYLEKPFDKEQLVKRVSLLLNGRSHA